MLTDEEIAAGAKLIQEWLNQPTAVAWPGFDIRYVTGAIGWKTSVNDQRYGDFIFLSEVPDAASVGELTKILYLQMKRSVDCILEK